MRGYFGIGIYCPKSKVNFGTLFRSANIFGASFVFLIGCRFKKQSSDTLRSERALPVYSYGSFGEFITALPHNCKLIAVENTCDASPLKNYVHPQQACYLLGAEESGLPPEVLESCHETVIIPGRFCLNVAVAGSIVMYDRISKGGSNLLDVHTACDC